MHRRIRRCLRDRIVWFLSRVVRTSYAGQTLKKLLAARISIIPWLLSWHACCKSELPRETWPPRFACEHLFPGKLSPWKMHLKSSRWFFSLFFVGDLFPFFFSLVVRRWRGYKFQSCRIRNVTRTRLTRKFSLTGRPRELPASCKEISWIKSLDWSC